MPFGRPTPGRPIGRPGVSHSQGVFGDFSYYSLVILFLSMVCLTVALAYVVVTIECVVGVEQSKSVSDFMKNNSKQRNDSFP
jgi:hypothetical protein